jgi:hypothetical protein
VQTTEPSFSIERASGGKLPDSKVLRRETVSENLPTTLVSLLSLDRTLRHPYSENPATGGVSQNKSVAELRTGGGRSLRRTRLHVRFPANREKKSDLA